MTSHQLHSNFTVTSRQLHTNFTQLHMRVKTRGRSKYGQARGRPTWRGPKFRDDSFRKVAMRNLIPSVRSCRADMMDGDGSRSRSTLPRPRELSRASLFLHGSVASRFSQLQKNFTATSQQLHSNFTQTSLPLHENFTRTSQTSHRFTITKSVTKLRRYPAALGGNTFRRGSPNPGPTRYGCALCTSTW